MANFKEATCSFCPSTDLVVSGSVRDKNTLEMKDDTFQLICKTCGRTSIMEVNPIVTTV